MPDLSDRFAVKQTPKSFLDWQRLRLCAGLDHLTTIAAFLVGWCLATAQVFSADTFYATVQSLRETNDEKGWKNLALQLANLKLEVEEQAGTLPYEDRHQMASLLLLLENAPRAEPGIYASWTDCRIVSQTPPRDGSSIQKCAAVIHGDLAADPKSPASLRKSKDYRRRLECVIHSSVVVIDGAVELDGYINNSIVVCTGPAKIYSYIANSLVISTYRGNEFSVDTEDGYISRSIVVAKRCRPGSARRCVLFGEVEGTDLRGADIKPWQQISERMASLAVPHRERVAVEEPMITNPNPTPSQRLQELLAAEDQVQAAMTAEQLTDAVLTKAQIESLIERAEAIESDVMQNILWHTIRLSRDLSGQQYLRQRLTRPDTEQQCIRFLQTLKNPSIEDVPLIIDIYRKASPHDPRSQEVSALDDVRQQVIRMATIDWQRCVAESVRNPEWGEAEIRRERELHSRRVDRAIEAQASLLRWLVRNSTIEDHKLDAFQAARRLAGWPNERKWMEPIRLKEDLLATSIDPKFRAKVIEQFGDSLELTDFLDSESHEVDAVRLAVIRALRKRIHAHPYGSFDYTPILQRTAQFDEASQVRAAATAVLAEIKGKPDGK